VSQNFLTDYLFDCFFNYLAHGSICESEDKIVLSLFFYSFWREIIIKNQQDRTEINFRIRDREVRVIADDGSQLGVMSSRDALNLAQEQGLDLVKINPGANPPVVKIMDYGKFKFDTAKKEKLQKKAQKASELKEIRLSMTIDVGDLQTKAKHANKFLAGGDKVKVSLRMKGRQQAHSRLGVEVMNDFFAMVEENGTMEKIPATEGRSIIMILMPKKQP